MGFINAVIQDISNINNITGIIEKEGKLSHNINNSYRIVGVIFSGFQSENPIVVSVKPDDYDFLNLYVFQGISGATGFKSQIFKQKIIIETNGKIEAPIYYTILYEIVEGGGY